MDAPETGPARPSPARVLATAAFVIAVIVFAIRSQAPPPALPADAPETAFSAARAMRLVELIARAPHPLGSPEAERVRHDLIGVLEGLGLKPEVQAPGSQAQEIPGPWSPGNRRDVRNIVARRKGSGPPGKKALLLVAHYDSVPAGPGAGDDASGVATILETLRALGAGPPLERDLIVLLSDGEEAGLFGAQVFAEEHPWAGDVGVVLNFEGRGSRGPVYLFETSDGNGWLIAQVARALPRPLATSLSMAIYKLMPNDTDLTIFKQRGMAGLNFAFGGGLANYHSPDDTPANLDPRTLQHHGDNALAMARRLGGLDLDAPRAEDVVYFSILGRMVAYYPQSWAVPLMAAVALAFAATIAFGKLRGRVRLLDVLVGFATFPFALVVAVFAAGGVWLVLRDITGNLGLPVVRYDLPILFFLAIVATIAAGRPLLWAGRRRGPEGLGLGLLGWWLAASVATALWLPGGSYLFALPLLATVLSQAAGFLAPRGGLAALGAAWVGALPLLLLFAPIFPDLFEGLNLRMAALLMMPVVLFAAALVPLASAALAPPRRAA